MNESAPLTPPECDLRDFPYMPLDVVRLRDSDIAAMPDPEAFRAAVVSWCVAWHQSPAGSLPDDDAVLCRLLGYGRDLKAWQRLRAAGALHGYVKCSDGRLYHPVVAEKATAAWRTKQAQRDRTEAARHAKLSQRQRQPLSQSQKTSVTENVTHPVASHVTQPVTGSKGEERKVKGELPPPIYPPPSRRGLSQNGNGHSSETPAFERFWTAYPHKVSKGHGRKAFATALRKVSPEAMLAALARQIDVGMFNREHQPNPATWLNGERWLDEVVSREDTIMRAAGLGPNLVIDDDINPEQRSLLQ